MLCSPVFAAAVLLVCAAVPMGAPIPEPPACPVGTKAHTFFILDRQPTGVQFECLDETIEVFCYDHTGFCVVPDAATGNRIYKEESPR